MNWHKLAFEEIDMKEEMTCKICNEKFYDEEIISHIIKNHQHELAGKMKRFQVSRDDAISLMVTTRDYDRKPSN
jgi:hypothetical protein